MVVAVSTPLSQLERSGGAPVQSAILPRSATWYELHTGRRVGPGRQDVVVSPDRLPVMVRGGSVIPMASEVGASTRDLAGAPLTLVVAVGGDGAARGELYLDDGESFAYRCDSRRRSGVYFLISISLVLVLAATRARRVSRCHPIATQEGAIRVV